MTMIEMDAGTVTVRGEDLHEVWWQGRQWAVTSYGVECRDGTYAIEASRLYERRYHAEQIAWSWPLHMADKVWCDIHDFCTAYCVALGLHRRRAKSKAFRRGEVQQTCLDAIERARRYREARRDDGDRLRLVPPSEMDWRGLCLSPAEWEARVLEPEPTS